MKRMQAMERRKSIRAFDGRRISDEMLRLVFEAARWAPSSRNEQPWIYMYAMRENEASFETFISCLNPTNQVWAQHAPVLILSLAKKHHDYKDRPNRYALHDVGAANAYLALQAADLGLQAHQMGGFDREKTIEAFGLDPEQTEPVTFIAVGFPGDPDSLPDELKKREKSPGKRKELDEIVREIGH